MPKKTDIKKVMVIGSGPIVIGQAAEFDYAGSQACRALKEEGIEVILLNSNPATIMTDVDMAHRVYMEPITPEFAENILRRERPDGLLPTLGGQIGLNTAKTLAENGVLEELQIQLLGTSLESIQKAEDRDKFKSMLENIGEPVPAGIIVSSVEGARGFAHNTGFPIIVRPAYTLGGTGGGMAYNMEQLASITAVGLKYSPINQVLLEKSVAGWKEIEYEVIRDAQDNCIIICSMENIDPMGIHTGDSIVVAPTQTLTDREHQMLRSASLKIIRALKIEGGCNIQFALNPREMSYYVIEVNPRVSRSSALASKATGYPIAKVASKVAIGLHLEEITNVITGKTSSCFEPAIDYCVVKYPRWPFDKFASAEHQLGTQMKATGEVMALGRNFQEALLKAVRSLEINLCHLMDPTLSNYDRSQLLAELKNSTDKRLFAVAEALRRDFPVSDIYAITGIDPYFLDEIKEIILLERELSIAAPKSFFPNDLLRRAKENGFSDAFLAKILGLREEAVRQKRQAEKIEPLYKMVDTCAAEFPAQTPYFYSTYGQENEAQLSSRPKVIVLGSGPIRIGQGVEFDYCSVHSAWALKEENYESIIINNNPETVSTDFDTSDRLYFEPLVTEDVLNVIAQENPHGVIVQFGGQTAINLAEPLAAAGIPILGTPLDSIDMAEDRKRFDELLEKAKIPRPPGGTATSLQEAEAIAGKVGYPILVRPSYVLGGRAMEIVYNKKDLKEYMESAVKVSSHHPVLIDKYLKGVELEVDALADDKEVVIPGIMEHIERAGIHSGDSIAVFPTINISQEMAEQVASFTTRLGLTLGIKGIFNIQYVLHENKLYVLEVNPRSSRTVPFISKVTGVPMVKLATRIALGQTLKTMGYKGGLLPAPGFVSVKAPVFSFGKLYQMETSLGPEMKSTGEVMGINRQLPWALHKALLASGIDLPPGGNVLATIADKDKEEAFPLLFKLSELGFNIMATRGTALFLEERGLAVERVNKVREGNPSVLDIIRSGKINLVLNTFTKGKLPHRDGFGMRRAAVELGVPCLTSLDTARAAVSVMEKLKHGEDNGVLSLQEYLAIGQL